MSDHAERDDEAVRPDVSGLVTEDDAPVDSLFQEKQMRLLVEPLYSSWRPRRGDGSERPFVAAADVGIFGGVHERAVVPDVLLSMDVAVPDEFWEKDKRSYYAWEFGKMPEVVIEIVSNREGDELEGKRAIYSKLRIANYVVYDHQRLLSDQPLRVFEMKGDLLVPVTHTVFPSVGLGLTEWTGPFETKRATWLRWCYPDGTLLPTGEERAEQERERAERERERAERLAARLRELGEEPE